MASNRLALPEAIWPPRVLLVESPGLRPRSSSGPLRAKHIEVAWVSDAYTALLMIGRGTSVAGLVLPTDLDPDPVPVVVSVMAWCDVPVLLALTSESGAAETATRGIEVGCSGLISAPFDESVLAAAVLRLGSADTSHPPHAIVMGEFTVDPGRLTVAGSDGVRVQLPSLQFACLHHLAIAWPAVVRLHDLADYLGFAGPQEAQRTRKLVTRLRTHLTPVLGGTGLVENVRGVGYRLRV